MTKAIKQGELYASPEINETILELFLGWFRIKLECDPAAIFTRTAPVAKEIQGIPVYQDENVPVNSVWMELADER